MPRVPVCGTRGVRAIALGELGREVLEDHLVEFGGLLENREVTGAGDDLEFGARNQRRHQLRVAR